MKEPKRLLDGGTALERSLLSSSQDEMPSKDLDRRVLAAMAGVPLASAATAPSLARWLSTKSAFAGLATIALGAFVIGGMMRREPVAVPASTTPAALATTTATSTPVEAPGEVVVTPDSLPNAPPRPTAPAPARTAAAPVPATASSASIAREIELLDSVKAKLAAGSATEAARALDVYDAELPHGTGTLRPEATVLRIRTLLLAGDRAGAERIGKELLEKRPNGVHAKRVRALLEEK